MTRVLLVAVIVAQLLDAATWMAMPRAVVAIAVGCIGAGSNLAVLAAVNAAEAPRSAPKPAPIAPAATGIEQGSMPAAPERTPAPRASAERRPERVGHAVRVPKGVPAPGAIPAVRGLRGDASWVRPSLGPRYLAARVPRGTILRICGPLRCVRRTVTDRGPRRRVFPGRIVDLSRADFALVCGNPVLLGTCPVRAWVVRRG